MPRVQWDLARTLLKVLAWVAVRLERSATAKHAEDEDDEGDHKQDVNQPTPKVDRKKSKSPENDEDDDNSFKHWLLP